LSSAPSCRSAAATTTACVGVFTVFTGWFCMKLWCRATASGENGYGKDSKIGCALVHLLFIPHQCGRLHREGAPSVELRERGGRPDR
jgi:hypothetical protein